MNHSWIVNSEEENIRLLAFIKKKIPGEKTTTIRYAVEHQGCRINQKLERYCSRKVRTGEKIDFRLEKEPALEKQEQAIIFEDDFLLIYAKPARLTSEALAECVGLPLVHRLDRDTSGLLLFAKNERTKEALERLFKKREIEKCYEAIVHGRCEFDRKRLENKMRIVARIPGKVIWGVGRDGLVATTEVVTVKKGKITTHLKLYPRTGRTHQLRVQLSHIGHPIVGDADYGSKEEWAHRSLLHASTISFTHPNTGEHLQFQCPLPRDFKQQLDKI